MPEDQFFTTRSVFQTSRSNGRERRGIIRKEGQNSEATTVESCSDGVRVTDRDGRKSRSGGSLDYFGQSSIMENLAQRIH